MQSYLEDTDPVNYARYFFREPPPGFAAQEHLPVARHRRSLHADPEHQGAGAGHGRAAGRRRMLEPIDGLDLAGLTWGDRAGRGNVAGGAATGVLLEYKAPAGTTTATSWSSTSPRRSSSRIASLPPTRPPDRPPRSPLINSIPPIKMKVFARPSAAAFRPSRC